MVSPAVQNFVFNPLLQRVFLFDFLPGYTVVSACLSRYLSQWKTRHNRKGGSSKPFMR